MSTGDIRIVFIDGQYQDALSFLADLSDYIDIEANQLTLRLPKKFHSEKPIFIDHINKKSGSRQIKQVIIAEENADAVIVESYRSEHQQEYSNRIETKIDLKSNARLRFYKWQEEGEKAKHHAELISQLAQNSYLGTYHVVKGSGVSSDRFSYSLAGEGSTCESIGFYQCENKQQFKIDSHIHHLSSNTNSRQLYKGIANGQSHAAFNGRVMVDPNIKEICAHQKNDNLLLSKQAQIDTKPELEIYSEDVQCSHGATVGQLDEEVLFYLRSRGVDEEMARDLLIDGFANEVFQSFPDKEKIMSSRGMTEGFYHD